MCGRYLLTTPIAFLREALGFTGDANLPPRFNIAPTQDVPVVVAVPGGGRRLRAMRWGLVPGWARAVAPRPLINARAETIAEKPAFRDALRDRRCLVPADGFYEWPETADDPRPWLFRMPEDAPFAFAGLWDRWTGPNGRPVDSVAIVTLAAAGTMAAYHRRMPAVLAQADLEAWLTGTPEAAIRTIRPDAGQALRAVRVGAHVNAVGNDDPRCIEPGGDAPPPGTQLSLL